MMKSRRYRRYGGAYMASYFTFYATPSSRRRQMTKRKAFSEERPRTAKQQRASAARAKARLFLFQDRPPPPSDVHIRERKAREVFYDI